MMTSSPQTESKTVRKGQNPEIKSYLESDTVFLAMIGPHAPIKITPEREVPVSIGLQEELDLERSLGSLKDEYEKLLLVVHSPGGGVRSSYKLARYLRTSFKEIKAFVPHLALSGGTLITLTGNEIVLGEMSNLTPIDIQVVYEGKLVSANSMIRALGNLNRFFTRHSEEEAPFPWISLARKLDPVILQEWMDKLELMKAYSKEILSHENAEFSTEEASSIVEHLGFRFPTHTYALMKDELNAVIKKLTGKEIVKGPSDYLDLWPSIKELQRKNAREEAPSHIFTVIEPKSKSQGGEK